VFGWLFRKKTKENNTDLLINELERALCAENTSFMCYSHFFLKKQMRIENF